MISIPSFAITESYPLGSSSASSSVCTIPDEKSPEISYSKGSMQRWHCSTNCTEYVPRINRIPCSSTPNIILTTTSPVSLLKLAQSLSISFTSSLPCRYVSLSAKRNGSTL